MTKDEDRATRRLRAADKASSLWTVLVRHRFIIQAAIDGVAWGFALTLATVLRHEFDVGEIDLGGLFLLIPVAAAIQLLAGIAGGLYLGRWRYGSFDEVATLTRTVVVATAVIAFTNRYLVDHAVPVSATIAGGVFALVLMAGARYGFRLALERRKRPSGDGAERVIIFGAGEGGVQVLTAMMRNPDSPYFPVALLDDDPRKRNLRIMGIPVAGTRASLANVAADLAAEGVVIAIPSASAELIRELSDLAVEAELDVRVLPSVAELFGGPVEVGDIRPLTDADLLGRHEIDTDVDAIAGYLTGKRVLVTGAGGSIGSELCRQIYRFAPAELVMLDRDESSLHAVQLSIEGRALLSSRNLVVADIRDPQRLDEVFAEHRPEVVFHAAALKHLPLLEMHPAEAVKTNIWGTQHVLRASADHQVERFVNISTDKAADPASVLGYTKRIAERLTSHADARSGGRFLSVRFGNVLGSRGSVLTAFHTQIQAGGPVTVTHPDATRYFMTVEEAVQLVIQAGAVGGAGEALVLDMGQPVRIDDVARRLASQGDRPVEVVYTGLRPGEKLHESLLGADEPDVRKVHPLISHVPVPPLDPAELELGQLDPSADGGEMAAKLDALCR